MNTETKEHDLTSDHGTTNPYAVSAATKRQIWQACVWSWPVCVVTFGFFFTIVAGFIPPPHENWTAHRIAEFYASNRSGIRVGLIGAMFASALMIPFFRVITNEMRKIEGDFSLLAPVQWGGAVILVCFFQIICLGWLLSSFRPDAGSDVIRLTNDYGWLVWTMLIPTYSLQFICMAVAGFVDRRPHPLWPRWAAYVNLFVAFTGAGGVLAVFLKKGPFSWNGLIGFWIPVTVFAAGMTMTMVLMLRRGRYADRAMAWSTV
jgi:hypothetical protein